MINPLSEQVAELEAKQHHLWDVKEAIRVENLELWSKNERLEAERDDLQRQVQEVRDEIATLRAGQGRWPGETIASEDVPFKGMTDLRYKEPAPAPRLTVHKLNVAPVGSVVRRLHRPDRMKHDDGRWHRAWKIEGQHSETSEELISIGWADATLHLPEDQS